MKDLKSLFESELLNEETKTVLKEAWDNAVKANRDEVEAEYAEKLNEASSEITKEAVRLVEEAVADEMQAVAEELAEARSLEVEYAEKLSIFKEQYAEKMSEHVDNLVKETVETELNELKEDIEFAKKHQFGVKLFEAFRSAYVETFGDDETNIHESFEELKRENEALRREKIMSGLLESVSGEKRRVIETILEGVATDKLEDKFENLRPIILKESEQKVDESEEVETKKGRVILENVDESDEEGDDQIDKISNEIARSLRFVRK